MMIRDDCDYMRDAVFSRRDFMAYGTLLGLGSAFGCATADHGARDADGSSTQLTSGLDRAPRRYDMKKSINMWAFPYPGRMTLQQCFELAARAGFDAVEVNYDLAGDLSPAAGEKELTAIRAGAEKAGIAISGVCSFLFWPFPFSAAREATRERAVELATRMIDAAHHLGTDNLLVVPGAVYIPWIKDSSSFVSTAFEEGQVFGPGLQPSAGIPYKACDERARAAVRRLLPHAEKRGVHLNMENIFFNGYLMSPADMIEFVDSFKSEHVHVHFDTGNIMPFQFPEHWIPLLGKRIRNVHLKEYNKRSTDFTLEGFRPLLDGTTNWPAVVDAFDAIGYRGYLTFEYFHPYTHFPEALIYQMGDVMDRMLGRPAKA